MFKASVGWEHEPRSVMLAELVGGKRDPGDKFDAPLRWHVQGWTFIVDTSRVRLEASKRSTKPL